MKNIFIAMALIASFAITAQPQSEKGRDARMERMESARIAFLTTRLDLTPAEAEKFWPVYNEMRGKIKDLMSERRQTSRTLRDNAELSALEKEALLLENYKRDQELARMRLVYHEQFKAVLGLEKTLLLAEAEMDFHRKMMERMGGDWKRGSGKGHSRD
jgi:Spy/CpxP family protein refolding chaperone